MGLPAIVIVANIIGIGASIVSAICESGIERERNYQRVIQWRRQSLKRETEYKARGKLLDYLSHMSKEVINQRKLYFNEINVFKDIVNQMRDYLNNQGKTLPPEQRKTNRQAVFEVETAINIRYGELYRLKLFLGEVYARKKELTSKSVYFKLAEKVPKLSLDKFFRGEDFPIAKHIVHAAIRSPIKGPEFMLDSGIRGELPMWEDKSQKEYSWGEKVKVFIERVNYKDKKAIVSLKRVELLSDENLSFNIFNAKIIRVHDKGCDVTISGIKCFLPRSKETKNNRPSEGKEVNVKILEKDLKTGNIIVTADFNKERVNTPAV